MAFRVNKLTKPVFFVITGVLLVILIWNSSQLRETFTSLIANAAATQNNEKEQEPFTVEGKHIVDLENQMRVGVISNSRSHDQHRSSSVDNVRGFSVGDFANTASDFVM
jgi:hypothetical protein